jgi:hypothetical protein
MVAGAATRFPAVGSRAAANTVTAIESAFPAPGLALEAACPAPRGKCGLLFYWLAMPFHNRKYRAYNQFLAAQHGPYREVPARIYQCSRFP